MRAPAVEPATVFLLPPPSTSRFVLLAMVLATVAVFTGAWAALRWGAWSVDDRCADPPPGSVDVPAAVSRCAEQAILGRGLGAVAAALALALAALLLTRLAPTALARCWRLEPLPADDPARATMDSIASASGLRRPPRWYVAPGLPVEAWTFRPGVVVTFGLSIAHRSRRAAALVAHELGHLRNRDVDRTYLVVTAAAVAAIGAAAVVVDAMWLSGATGAAIAARTVALTVVLGLTLLAVLRAREHDADLRVAVTSPEDMVSVFETPAVGRRRRTPRWLRFHPAPDDRIAAIRDPSRIMRLSAAECLTTGLCAGLTATELGPVVERLLIATAGVTVSYVLTGLIIAVPVVGVVGAACARARLGGRRRGKDMLASGGALGAGFLVGTELSLRSAAYWPLLFVAADDRDVRPGLVAADPASAAWLAVLAVGGGLLIIGWCAAAAEAWLAVPGGPRWPTALLTGAVVLAGPLGGWFLAARLAASSGWEPALLATALVSASVGSTLASVVAGSVVLVLLRWRAGQRAGTPRVLAVVALATVALVAPAIGGVDTESGPAVPTSHQAGIACIWLRGQDVLTRPRDDRYLTEVGRYLAETDQDGLRTLGSQLASAPHRDSADLVVAVQRWCAAWLTRQPEGTR